MKNFTGSTGVVIDLSKYITKSEDGVETDIAYPTKPRTISKTRTILPGDLIAGSVGSSGSSGTPITILEDWDIDEIGGNYSSKIETVRQLVLFVMGILKKECFGNGIIPKSDIYGLFLIICDKQESNSSIEDEINVALTELAKLGYVSHPESTKFSGKETSSDYSALTDKNKVRYEDAWIGEDTYRLYHIMDSGYTITASGNIYDMPIKNLSKIKIDDVKQYDQFLFEDKSSVLVYEVIEKNDDSIRLLSISTDVQKVSKYLNSKQISFVEQTLGELESQTLTRHLGGNID